MFSTLAREPMSPLVPPLEQLATVCSEELVERDRQGLLRRPRTIEAVAGARVRVAGREVVNWCSNDYLGLSTHPRLIAAAVRAAQEWGVGARASRLLSGNTRWHERLEAGLAEHFGHEAALVYPSGYLANLGTIGALVGSGDTVWCDRLCHASLIEAVRASGATLRIFPHNDPEPLRARLARGPRARRRLIVTEGVFSMEGDRAPLGALAEVAHAAGAILYVDDAHGAFLVGASRRGSPEAAGLGPTQCLYMGTLGKALGAQGGFIVGPRSLIESVQNRSKAFIYTTALATPVVAAAVEALALIREEPLRHQTLASHTRVLHEQLRRLQGYPLAAPSHIVPIVVGDARAAISLSARLWERGIWAPAIRPPTVSARSARLRLSVTASHTPEQVSALIQILKAVSSKP